MIRVQARSTRHLPAPLSFHRHSSSSASFRSLISRTSLQSRRAALPCLNTPARISTRERRAILPSVTRIERDGFTGGGALHQTTQPTAPSRPTSKSHRCVPISSSRGSNPGSRPCLPFHVDHGELLIQAERTRPSHGRRTCGSAPRSTHKRFITHRKARTQLAAIPH